ncbi:palmitoyl-acyl carrier protein thioesterase, chloroplastic-like [Diospyros lotus]|uniref:palmitoyl-acyl carrier protein thioesterase, chloroplastic-like n=1 Tax=Diospyros lotus TaxID=55363 RepID=UPI0022563DD7|nr:palmitoyl-acyl carrier protein thioesterase, chloroplastic-like [Diospyros lotus]
MNDILAMKSMASAKTVSFAYPEDLLKAENMNAGTAVQGLKVGFCGLSNPAGKARLSLVVKANAGNHKSVDMINGRKVNGIAPGRAPHLGTNQRSVNEAAQAWLHGRFVEDRFVYRQTFVIRSYEIGPEKTATMETLMNLLQETALNHVTSSGLAGNGFGATREMSIRKLIWVVTRIHVQVEKYSSWGDVVEIDTWVDAAGKNGMRRDWIIRDYNTQRIITRATSTWVIMNRETRRLSKIPDEVRKEVQPFYLDRIAISTEDVDSEKIEKLTDGTADRVRSGLAPRWNDMDANQHVNNVKYIGWILESVPIDVLEDYNLTSMTLEYRRECRQSNVLESLTTTKPKSAEESSGSCRDGDRGDLESTHLLRMQADKAEIVRARSVWEPKPNYMI